jgi:phosphatidylserine decarboxylase
MMAWVRAIVQRLAALEELNFLLTNRIPRRAATRFMGWFSRIEHPLVARASIAVWRLFCDVDLGDARESRFASLHRCFVRELRDGARPFDPDPGVMASPCDAIVGAFGPVEQGQAFQVKGLPYRVSELVGSVAAAARFRRGTFVTLRLTAGMYHHFHAPHDLSVREVTHLHGDTWNVNPPALKRIERLYCRNERAAIHCELEAGGGPLTLVAVAAILVAGIRLPFLADAPLRRLGSHVPPLDARFFKGQRLGWFEHGSTLVVLAPPGWEPRSGLETGTRVRAGEALLRLGSEAPGGTAPGEAEELGTGATQGSDMADAPVVELRIAVGRGCFGPAEEDSKLPGFLDRRVSTR